MANSEKSRNPIYLQDEILQMMYWMRGEGLATAPTLIELNRFLNLDETLLKTTVRRLVEVNYLEYIENAYEVTRVKLTERGIAEGKRRFREEFESYLGKESHLQCDDPDCECHDPNWDGVCHNLGQEHQHR